MRWKLIIPIVVIILAILSFLFVSRNDLTAVSEQDFLLEEPTETAAGLPLEPSMQYNEGASLAESEVIPTRVYYSEESFETIKEFYEKKKVIFKDDSNEKQKIASGKIDNLNINIYSPGKAKAMPEQHETLIFFTS